MSNDSNSLKPIVIKRKIRANHPLQGGAWKESYAGFVTAMMAFFLLLWLLLITTESNKKGISNYFEPDTSEEEKLSGSGQTLAGLAQVAEGALKFAGSTPSVTVAIVIAGSKTGGDESKEDKEDAEALAEAEEKRLQTEMENFAKVEAEIRQGLQEIPELKDMQDSLMIDNTPEGLRIQILDQEDIPMFGIGGAVLNDHGRKMLAIIANVIAKLPNAVVLTGHTDTSKSSKRNYGNWELSGDRANTARRAMVEFGLDGERIAKIAGKADKEHLFPDKPSSFLNRRISIILQKQKLLTELPDSSQQKAASNANSEG
jgi:chemotaxis protein MotB